MTTERKLMAAAVHATLFAMFLSAPAFADTIQITDAEAELEDGGTAADVFLNIMNTGAVADRLYAVKSPVAGEVLFSSLGEAEEREAEGRGEEIPRAIAYEVKAGEEFRLHHDGPHITLRQLRRQLNTGDTFTLTLFFEQGGPMQVEVEIEDH